jgi:hypothetical protein
MTISAASTAVSAGRCLRKNPEWPGVSRLMTQVVFHLHDGAGNGNARAARFPSVGRGMARGLDAAGDLDRTETTAAFPSAWSCPVGVGNDGKRAAATDSDFGGFGHNR